MTDLQKIELVQSLHVAHMMLLLQRKDIQIFNIGFEKGRL